MKSLKSSVKSSSFSFRLPVTVSKAVREFCKKNDIPVSVFIRLCIVRYLEAYYENV